MATFILGFLDRIELTLIILPVVAQLGFDPVWFTVLFAVSPRTSFLTPPVGSATLNLKGTAPPAQADSRHAARSAAADSCALAPAAPRTRTVARIL